MITLFLDILLAVSKTHAIRSKINEFEFGKLFSIHHQTILKTEKKKMSILFFFHLSVMFFERNLVSFLLFNSVASVKPDVDFFREK